MSYLQVGKTDLMVSPLCLGGNVFGWTADERESHAVLDAYADAGGNFIDTADAYGAWVEGNPPGASEQIIGRWLKSRGGRDDFVIATKVGMMPDREGLSFDNIIRSAEESLERLQTDHIDLYYAHADDPSVEPEETLSAFTELIERGLVRHIAASNYSPPRLQAALSCSSNGGLASYVALQTHYNLLEREGYEAELMQVCDENQIGCLPYYALASGFLTGKYRSSSSSNGSERAGTATAYLDGRGLQVLDALEKVAAEHQVSMSAVALAWLAQRPTVLAPIASARTPEQLSELLEIVDLRLTPEEEDLLAGASAQTAPDSSEAASEDQSRL
jgi:aryl-alcohol dehydrogenase-like predicted oxidoreductase